MLDANLGPTKSAGHFNNVKNRNDNNIKQKCDTKKKCDTFNISDNEVFFVNCFPYLFELN